jgi:hypothetical protein
MYVRRLSVRLIRRSQSGSEANIVTVETTVNVPSSA